MGQYEKLIKDEKAGCNVYLSELYEGNKIHELMTIATFHDRFNCSFYNIQVWFQLKDFSLLINKYHQKLEAEENEEEEDTSLLLEEIVRKTTLSAQSNGDSQANRIIEEKKEMNGGTEINEVKKGEG